MQAIAKHFITDESGATAIEYGLIAALIFLAMVLGFTLLTNSLGESLNDTNQKIHGATN